MTGIRENEGLRNPKQRGERKKDGVDEEKRVKWRREEETYEKKELVNMQNSIEK